MKILLPLFFCLLGLLGFTQTKIKITNPVSSQHDYQLETISDTTFIKITHKEDMGVWYEQSYTIKSTAPDGKYEVYVDNHLELIAFIKRSQKDSIWTSHYNNGKIKSVQTYKDGKLNGEVINYYINGIISFRGVFVDNKAVDITTSFDESGKIKAKNYYKNEAFLKQEIFSVDGEIKSTYYPPKN